MKESKLVDYISILIKVCLSAQLILFILKLCGIFKGEWWLAFFPTYIMIGLMAIIIIAFYVSYKIIKSYMKRHGYKDGDYKTLLEDLKKEEAKRREKDV